MTNPVCMPMAIAALPTVAETVAQYGAASRWIEVLVDCPGAPGLYTYAVPTELCIKPGDILSVPFGAQQMGAIALRWVEQLPEGLDLKSVRSVDDVISAAFFPPGYWILLQQVADYYQTPLMQAVRVALPPGILGRSQRRIRLKPDAIPPGATEFLSPPAQQVLQVLQKTGDYTWTYLQRQGRGARRGIQELLRRGWAESYLEAPAPVRPKRQQAVVLVNDMGDANLSDRQREIIEILKRRGGDLWLQELLQICHVSSSVVKTLERKGHVVIQSREVLRTVSGQAQPDQPKQLTAAQQAALRAIAQGQGSQQWLLHGVTGSGKTEVYLQAIAPVLARGQSALVLVPEIGLTPQLTDRFQARFGEKVRVYHSALSDGERYDTWRQMLRGDAQVIVGTRSAVFAPLPNLGLIVLDEEHDGSFKQDQPAPCYHARTVAQWRSHLVNCPLVLGSATPALDSWVAAQPSLSDALPSPMQYLSLPDRIQSRPMPPIQVVDMRQEFSTGNRSIFSRPLQLALEELQSTQQQGLLFIHRRGHSTFVSCRACGYVMECPHCDVSLAYHHTHADAQATLRCHYCGYGRSLPEVCPSCTSPYFKQFGSGTQRVMQELHHRFPNLRSLRFDSDTTRAKDAHRTLLTQFAQGEADVLVGTQMLTKGIDLPQVTLVGIVAADGVLNLADYRASERAFQTLTQVAGRAGRGDQPGRVILQTYSPEHPVIQAVQQQQYASFIQEELDQRAALNYPPVGRLILLRLSSLDAVAVQQASMDLAQIIQAQTTEDWHLLGPAPASVTRVAQRYRWQILLKGSSHAIAPDLQGLRSHLSPVVSLTIDVDPLTIL
nr:primosomal protein N' [Leptolyngbya sp. CCY15150]